MTRLDINFSINKQTLKCENKIPLRAEDNNYFYAVFTFDETWADVVAGAKASFVRLLAGKKMSFVMPLTINSDGSYECKIPWEVMSEKGEFYVGVFGGDKIITNAVCVDVAASCMSEGVAPTAPTQDWFTKIETKIDNFEPSAEIIAEAIDNYLTQHPMREETDPIYLADKPTLATKAELFSGNYADLSGTPTIPSKTSQLQNDSGYLTQHQSLDGYATETYVAEAIADIPSPDLSNYALKEEIPDVSGFISEIPTATNTTIGGVKPDGTTITVTEDGTISSVGGGGAEVSIATINTVGTVKPDDTSITIAEDGTISGAGQNVSGNLSGGFSVNITRHPKNKITGSCSVAAGWHNTVSGYYAFATGQENKVRGDFGFSAGRGGTISAIDGVVVGDYCQATGYRGIAMGYSCTANGENSFSMGKGTIAKGSNQFASGAYNIEDTANTYATIVGNGVNNDNRANAYTLDWSGNAVFAGTVSNSGSDYAEYFEWTDGNENAEDRIGYIVTLDGDKIKKANPADDILGIISGTMTVLGDDAAWNWRGKYLRDEFGRIQYHFVDKDIIEPRRIIDEETQKITWEDVIVGTKQVLQPIINPEYNTQEQYVSRKDRKEWDAVGMLGKLYVRDDSTCQVNGYAKCGANGVATASTEQTNMRVLKRINDNVIRVILK